MDANPEKLTTGEALSVDELVQYLPALKEVSAVLLKQYAVGAAVRRNFRAGDIVCEEGEFGSTAFYIVEGQVDIYIGNPLSHLTTKPKGTGAFSWMKKMTSMLVSEAVDSRETAERGFIPIDASIDLPRTTPIALLGPGELIGEMTCRTFQPRSATVRAQEDCVMVEMLRVILDMLVGTRDVDPTTKATTKVKAPTFKGTSFKKQMDEQYRARSLANHLRTVPIFATIDLDFFNYIRQHAELASYSKGEVICNQGAPADAFYLIRTGLVRVSQKMPYKAGVQRTYLADKTSGKQFWFMPDGHPVEDELVRTYLKRGEFFGEIGLLRDQARNATCSALDAVDLVKIGKDDFQLMLEKFPVVRATLEQISEVRVEADRGKMLPVGLQLAEFIDQGLFEAQNLLLIDLDNCTRCDACVAACADAHDGVTRLIRDGLRYDRFLVATACRSCRDPLCMTQCPVGSIRRKESLEIIIEDWCIGCTKCAELCPYGNINMHGFDVMKEVPVVEKKPAVDKAAAGKTAPPAVAASKPATAPAPAKDPAKDPAPAKAAATVGAEVRAEVASAKTIPASGGPAVDPSGASASKPSPPAASAAAAAVPQTAPTTPSATVPPEANAQVSPAPARPVAAAPAPESSAPVPAKPAPAPASPKPAGAAAAKPATPAAPKKMERKMVTVQKATTCDLCTQLSVPSCVYACPHDAAKRVEPTEFLARQIGREDPNKRRFRWLSRPVDRTTH
jgi:CRP-like cAMP-binding protein/Fe-S-cluster-containing hydrogenase component 2